MLDDFGLAKLNADHRRDLLEFLKDLYTIRSTLVTSQLPHEKWHDWVGDRTSPTRSSTVSSATPTSSS